MGFAPEQNPAYRPEVYATAILPLFADMKPPPLVTVRRFHAGRHAYATPEPDLPFGIAPAVFASWDAAIRGGYFVADEPLAEVSFTGPSNGDDYLPEDHRAFAEIDVVDKSVHGIHILDHDDSSKPNAIDSLIATLLGRRR